MRIVNDERIQARNNPLKEREIEDKFSEVNSNINKDSLGQTKGSLLQATTKSNTIQKPVTLNELLTKSVGKLTMNSYIKTLIQTNEQNTTKNNTLKEQVKMLKARKEETDINMIHYNTEQLSKNKMMIDNNADLKQLSKNPGGKPRNPKLDQESR